MRRKESKYAAIVCAFTMAFSSMPIYAYASDEISVDVTQSEEVQDVGKEKEDKPNISENSQMQTENENAIKESLETNVPIEIQGMSVVGNKDNISTATENAIKLKLKNNSEKGIYYIQVFYQDDSGYNSVTLEQIFNENEKPEDGIGEYEIPISIGNFNETGKYHLTNLYIVTDGENVSYGYEDGQLVYYNENSEKYSIKYNGEIDLNVTEVMERDTEAPYVTSVKLVDDGKINNLYGAKNEAFDMEIGYKENLSGVCNVEVMLKNQKDGTIISGFTGYGEGEKEAGEGTIPVSVSTQGVAPGEYKIDSITITDYANNPITYSNTREYKVNSDTNTLIDNEDNEIDISNIPLVKINKVSNNGLKLSNIRWNDETKADELHIGDQAKGVMTIRNDSQKDIVIDPKTCIICWSSENSGIDSYATGEGGKFILKSGYDKEIPFTLNITKYIEDSGRHIPSKIILNNQNETVSTRYENNYLGSDSTKMHYIQTNEPLGVKAEEGYFDWNVNYTIADKIETSYNCPVIETFTVEKNKVASPEKIKFKIKMTETPEVLVLMSFMDLTMFNKSTEQTVNVRVFQGIDFVYSESEHSYIITIPTEQMSKGEYYVKNLVLYAYNGNQLEYNANQYNGDMTNESGTLPVIKTVTFTVESSEPAAIDYTAPILENIEIAGSNKVTSPGEVTYRIKASDANKLSEVKLFYLYNKGINAMTLKSSSIKEESEGTYLCTFKIEEYHESGDYQLQTIGLIDGSAYKNDRAYKYNEETGEFESQDMVSVKAAGDLALTKEGNEVIASGEKNLEDEVKRASDGTTIVVADLQKELIIPTETMAEIKDKNLTLVVADDDRTSKLIINGKDLEKVSNKDLKVTVERGMMTEEESQVGTEDNKVYYPVNVTTTDASIPVTLRVKLDKEFLNQVSQKNICLSRRNADGTNEVIQEQMSVTADGYVEYTFTDGLSERQKTKQSLPVELDKLYSAVTLASDLNATVEKYEFIISAQKQKEVDVVPGDINRDGSINIQDLMLCLNHVSQKALLTGDALTAADVDGSGKVDIRDLMRLLNFVSGKSATL